ncbi:LuxR family transcriptional regulator [Nocardioides sp.]|uniref:helix-turn-helix transcriptional regulator n=1 Tax=Nocardioides sp. TaxID=35761 RepID=UPI00286ADB79|nr:LuxR family transcriptional regulator [Nocardioides sp.]
MSRVHGRLTLLTEILGLLDRGDSVALHGPSGVGKSALLDLIEDRYRSDRGAVSLRAGGAVDEHALPFAALRDLMAQLPAELVEALPDRVRGCVEAGLVGLDVTDELRSDLAAGFHAALDSWSQEQPVLLLLDDVQWLDAESSRVVGYARRRLRGRVSVAVATGVGDNAEIDVSGLCHVEVAPLGADDMVDLLCAHGLRAEVAQKIYVESGGIPSLALALAGALGTTPSLLGRPTPLPTSLERVLRDRFLAQPDDVRDTLRTVALLHRPTLRHLERAGRLEGGEHLRRAQLAGLVTRADDTVRFAPTMLRAVVVETIPAAERSALHLELARVAVTPGERLRHRALADPRPDADLARALGAAAHEAATRGGRELAAELYLLAADRAPCDLAGERTEWLVTAVETAAPGNHVDLLHRGITEVLERPGSRAQAVRVRLAIPELAGSGPAVLDEVLTAALADARDDDRLVAMVLLQRARMALMESRPAESARSAERAVTLLEASGDTDDLAVALTLLAVSRRWLGLPHAPHLARAVALGVPTPTGYVHTSPDYMAARFAFYDDRLDEAWEGFQRLLAHVERAPGMDQVHVLRCLVEVGARAGRCRETTAYAERAVRVGEELGLSAHTGWFIAAQAEIVGGDLVRARTLAARGAAAADEGRDNRYLQRHLVLLGQALLRSGDAGGARDALTRIRDLEREHGIADPTINRWQADLVSALVLLGRLDDAEATLVAARHVLDARPGTDGVAATLDRAEAELLIARGDLPGAEVVLDRSAKICADLGMRVDVGRSLVTRAHLERRRRRVAAARSALERADAVFSALHAGSWVAQVRGGTPADRAAVPVGLLDQLTPAEARVAHEVAAGASNREIAERTYVSVKTVEATLTRVYRKLGVRSRTQLATLLGPVAGQAVT